MMFLRLAVTCALICLLAAAAAAQEPVSAETEQEIEFVKSKSAAFFRSLTDKSLGPERAFRELIENGPLKDRNEEINKLIAQAATLDQRYGPFTGTELVSSKAVGSDLIFLCYLYKGERFPVVWYFTFYRAASIGGVRREWTLIALRFDAKIEALE
jgi:hypothetical protein